MSTYGFGVGGLSSAQNTSSPSTGRGSEKGGGLAPTSPPHALLLGRHFWGLLGLRELLRTLGRCFPSSWDSSPPPGRALLFPLLLNPCHSWLELVTAGSQPSVALAFQSSEPETPAWRGGGGWGRPSGPQCPQPHLPSRLEAGGWRLAVSPVLRLRSPWLGPGWCALVVLALLLPGDTWLLQRALGVDLKLTP